jgi:hypothetical protein
MQDEIGIISYLKYYDWKKDPDPKVLNVSRAMRDYLIQETLTPDTRKYPRFTHLTGWRNPARLLVRHLSIATSTRP